MENNNLAKKFIYGDDICTRQSLVAQKTWGKNIFSFTITRHCQCALVQVSATLIVAFYDSKPLLQASMHHFVLNYVVFALFCVFNWHLLPQLLAQRCENWCASSKFSGEQVSVLIFLISTKKLTSQFILFEKNARQK
jgi:hypothetical protein